MDRLRQMLKTTAVRLTLVYTLLFGLLAVGVVAYISYNTGRLLISQFQVAVDEEVREISRLSRRAGIRRLIPMVERRSRRPGANLYLISDTTGRIIAGNVRDIDRELLAQDGWKIPPFSYEGFDDGERPRRAIARVFTLPGELRLLVGRDIGEAEQFRSIVFRASTISLGVLVLTGLLLWFFVGRRALRHIDSVSQASERIIGGDLSERLPISGSGDEFDRLSSSLNKLIARVERLNTGVAVMSDSIAHDLKTPLTRLRNRAEAELAKSGKVSNHVLQDVISDADGLIKTFDALLMISQVESGARAVDLEQCELSAIIRDVYELFEPSADEIGVSLNLTIEKSSFVSCNKELLTQAITNLLDNALKYGVSSPSPQIELSLSHRGNKAVISINDNGVGIDSADRAKVLERFVRLDKSRSKPGSGLGLSLVEAIVKLHSGELNLESNQPGLKSEIVLPLAS